MPTRKSHCGIVVARPLAGFLMTSPTSGAALVTGVSHGSMGHGIALALARKGCQVACIDVLSHEESLRAATAEITAATGQRCLPLTADCTNRDELTVAFGQAIAELGNLRVVVAAVGGAGYTGSRSPGQEVQDSPTFTTSDLGGGFSDMITTTQFATYHTMQLAAQAMLAHGETARLIIIGSVMADMGRSGSAAYAVSKAAVRQLSKVLATELGESPPPRFPMSVTLHHPVAAAYAPSRRSVGHHM